MAQNNTPFERPNGVLFYILDLLIFLFKRLTVAQYSKQII
jgi:hypothetical protein